MLHVNASRISQHKTLMISRLIKQPKAKTYDFKVDQSKIDPSSTTPAETPSGEYPENHFVMKQATNATLTPTDSKRLFSEYEIVNLYIEFLCFFSIKIFQIR